MRGDRPERLRQFLHRVFELVAHQADDPHAVLGGVDARRHDALHAHVLGGSDKGVKLVRPGAGGTRTERRQAGDAAEEGAALQEQGVFHAYYYTSAMERPKFDPAREREFIARGWWRDDTLPAWLATHAQRRARAPALAWQGDTLTWAQLHDRVLRAAAGLKRRGVQRGDVVAVQLPNSPEFVIAYLAICRLGAAMCTLHMPYRNAEIEALMRHGRARLAVCLPDRKEMFAGAGVAFAEIADDALLAPNHPQPEAADVFLLLYTSGTTAAPKGVPHPYRTLLSNARLGAPEHKLDSRDRVLSAAPFSHLYGLYSLHCAWAVGACTVLLPAFKPDDLSFLIKDSKPTALWPPLPTSPPAAPRATSMRTTGRRSSSRSFLARARRPNWCGT
jgi:non-ribosomal peptide synthetase component F